MAFARADDAAWMHIGDAGNFTKNDQIRMVQEHVWVAISNKRVRVHALFQFKNEGPTTTVTMAFPDGILDYKERKPSAPRAIRWMKSKVDGKPVKVKRQVYRKDPSYDNYTHVWLKKVSFKGGQTRFVTVDYEANHGDIGDYINDMYTLKTGATWKGTIGKAVIYIDWSALNGQMDPMIRTVNADGREGPESSLKMIGPRSARLQFKNFEPDFDIGMSWAPAFWNFFLNGRRVDGIPIDDGRSTFVSGNGSDPQIYVESIPNLFLSRDKAEAAVDHETDNVEFDFKGKEFQVKKDRLYINGKSVKLRRGYRKGEFGTWIYVKDLVKLLRGSYRYDSKWDRAFIRL
jgi:hypothetical protein